MRAFIGRTKELATHKTQNPEPKLPVNLPPSSPPAPHLKALPSSNTRYITILPNVDSIQSNLNRNNKAATLYEEKMQKKAKWTQEKRERKLEKEPEEVWKWESSEVGYTLMSSILFENILQWLI